jgi:hypothetical protein
MPITIIRVQKAVHPCRKLSDADEVAMIRREIVGGEKPGDLRKEYGAKCGGMTGQTYRNIRKRVLASGRLSTFTPKPAAPATEAA